MTWPNGGIITPPTEHHAEPDPCELLVPSPKVTIQFDAARLRDALRPLIVKMLKLGAAFARYDHAMHSERNRQMHTAYRARARRRTRRNR